MTILFAQPFRRKVVTKHETIVINNQNLKTIVEATFNALADSMTTKFIPIVGDYERMKQAEAISKIIVGKTGTDSSLQVKMKRSRAGEIRKPSTLPKNATAEEKRKLKNRLRARDRRAKQRAALSNK